MKNPRLKLLLTPIAAAVIGALVLHGCGGGGGGSDDSFGGAGGGVLGGGGFQSPLIGVQMTLTCGDGTTKLTTTAGTDANPGVFSFASVPSSCAPPYLIEATGKGEMRSLDGSGKVPFDPAVNAPVRTISFDPIGSSGINVTTVTSLVVDQALAAAAGATDGAKLKTIAKDADLDKYRANLAPSLADSNGNAPATTAEIKAAVNASPAQKPEVAKLASVIADVVQSAVASDVTGVKTPAAVMSSLNTDVKGTLNIADPTKIVSVTGFNPAQVKQKSESLGNIVSAVVTDFQSNASGKGAKVVATANPIDAITRAMDLLSAAKSDMSVPSNEALVRSQAVAQIITQGDSAVTQAVALIRASTSSTAEQTARIKSTTDAANALKDSQLLTASAAIDAAKVGATAAAKAVDIDKIVTQTAVTAKIVATQIGGDKSNVYASTTGTVNPAAAVALSTKALTDVKAAAPADLFDATKLAAISTNASAVAGEFAGATPFAPPSTVGSTGAAPRPDLDDAAIKAAVIATVQEAPVGVLTTAQLTGIQTYAENLAKEVEKVVVANVGTMASTVPPQQQIAILVNQVQTGGAGSTAAAPVSIIPATIDFATPPAVGTVPTVVAATTTTTLPKIVPSTTTTSTTLALCSTDPLAPPPQPGVSCRTTITSTATTATSPTTTATSASTTATSASTTATSSTTTTTLPPCDPLAPPPQPGVPATCTTGGTTTTASAATTTASAATTTATTATTTATVATTTTTTGISFSGICQVKAGSALGYVTGVSAASLCTATGTGSFSVDGGGTTNSVYTGATPAAGTNVVAVGSLNTCDSLGAPPSAGATTLIPCKN